MNKELKFLGSIYMFKIRNKSIYYALLCHALEKYDIFLYGVFIPIVAHLYFPSDNKLITSLCGFATFAVGYLVRPFGALYFGHIGDRYGRKASFIRSVMLAIPPTIIIGFIPTYNSIGIIAPIILISCRLMQGFCAGGEFSGAVIYIMELLPDNKKGYAASIVRSVSFFGVAFGTILGIMSNLSFVPSWGWRIPFIIGGVTTIIVSVLRKKMIESPCFIEEKQKSPNSLTMPLVIALKEAKANIVCALGTNIYAYVLLYFTTVYLSSLYISELKLSISMSMFIGTFVLISWGILTYVAGQIADKVGLVVYLLIVSIFSIVALFPLFYFFRTFSLVNLLALQLALTLIGSLYLGPEPGLFKILFPAKYRYSASSLANTLAQILGGLTPLFAKLLTAATGDAFILVIILMSGAVIATLSLTYIYMSATRLKYVHEQIS